MTGKTGLEHTPMTRIPARISGRIGLMMVTTALLCGCAEKSNKPSHAMLANPASVYCKEQGGKLEIRREKDGEVGYCHLAYGRIVEEWTLFRAAHHDRRAATNQ